MSKDVVPKGSHLDSIGNANASAMSWRTSFFTMTGFAVVLSVLLGVLWFNQQVVLVPHELATLKGPVKVSGTGRIEKSDPEYMTAMALSDLSLILNWTPETVITQYQRFLNRATSELYARENINLMQEAEKNRSNATTQAFFPETTTVDLAAGRVIVKGTLVRWVGDKESMRVTAQYQVTYRVNRGYLHVSKLELTKQ